MKISKMSISELNLEINRAKFWVEISSISKSLKMINKMENRKLELIKKKLDG